MLFTAHVNEAIILSFCVSLLHCVPVQYDRVNDDAVDDDKREKGSMLVMRMTNQMFPSKKVKATPLVDPVW